MILMIHEIRISTRPLMYVNIKLLQLQNQNVRCFQLVPKGPWFKIRSPQNLDHEVLNYLH